MTPTMIGLTLAGRLEECETFTEPLDAEHLRRLWLADENATSFARENLARAREVGCSPEILSTLEYAVWSFTARQTLIRAKDMIRSLPTRALAKRILNRR